MLYQVQNRAQKTTYDLQQDCKHGCSRSRPNFAPRL